MGESGSSASLSNLSALGETTLTPTLRLVLSQLDVRRRGPTAHEQICHSTVPAGMQTKTSSITLGKAQLMDPKMQRLASAQSSMGQGVLPECLCARPCPALRWTSWSLSERAVSASPALAMETANSGECLN